jgi:hypothetical protein
MQRGSLTQKSSQRRSESSSDNCRVVVRVRPPLAREFSGENFLTTVVVDEDRSGLTLYEYFNIDLVEEERLADYAADPGNSVPHRFTFDTVYDDQSTQEEIYLGTAQESVLSTIEGFNNTIMAYGQTGTGKTHTMEGFKYNGTDPQRGIIPRAIDEIFKYIECKEREDTKFMVRASYLQIYNESISDLLRPERYNLNIREDVKKGIFVDGLSEWAVRNPSEIYSLLMKGANSRATAATNMNDVSSRSHAVFILIIERMKLNGDEDLTSREIRVGKLNLVDLAGSERVRVTGATGQRLEECKKINKSLSCLGNVISSLTDSKGPKSYIPYRDSKLTRLLEDSLGGNCKTTMMAMISPAVEAFSESLSSLKFAHRAKSIKNKAVINEDVDQRALLRKYENELKKLRAELEERSRTMGDRTRLLQLEEEKRRMEMDNKEYKDALEKTSNAFIKERGEKRALEQKIKSIDSQMLLGGVKIEDTPQFRNALEQHQEVLKREYENKIKALEVERQRMISDKGSSLEVRTLIDKQRDIMIAMTTKLNERSEVIVQLQDELEAYDRIHKENEEMIEEKIRQVRQLEGLLKERGIPLPAPSARPLQPRPGPQEALEIRTQLE